VRAKLRRLAIVLGTGTAILAGSLYLSHLAVVRAARAEPPQVTPVRHEASSPAPGLRRLGDSYVLERKGLLEVGLSGSPEQIGYAHARLLYREMVENEGVLLRRFEEQIKSSLLRTLVLDLAQFRYRNVQGSFSADRRLEIAAGALGFQPDPYAGVFPTYQRFVYLNALYDISLSFEHSPLIGCTTFTFHGAASSTRGGILARAFDFEVDDVFDRGKAVFLVKETGKIPFASVAWPGLAGVVSGMNREGLALVVHGGRAGEARAEGEPVVHALRRVLSTARNADEAVVALEQAPAMVSHIVILTDRHGKSLVVERVPDTLNLVRALAEKAVTTNHFEGRFARDPKNLAVLEQTSSRPRRQRGDELLLNVHTPIDAPAAVALLRDRSGVGGAPLKLGDRAAIDALIATHGVVMDTKRLILWVSVAPHLLGRFVAFDLARMLADDYEPSQTDSLPEIAEDPLLTEGGYAKYSRDRASP